VCRKQNLPKSIQKISLVFTFEFKHYSEPKQGTGSIAGGLALYIKHGINYQVVTVDNPKDSDGELHGL
jgi:hypothetical protein